MDTLTISLITFNVLFVIGAAFAGWWFVRTPTKTKHEETDRVSEDVNVKEERDEDEPKVLPDADSIRGVDPEREVYAKSPTPWVKLVSDEYDPDGGFKVTLDWNDAFIQRLKKSGYTGVDDEQLVQKWLAQTAMTVAKDLHEQSFDSLFDDKDLEDNE